MMSIEKVLFSFLVIISANLVLASPIDDSFNQFIEKFNITYKSSHERAHRRGIFEQNWFRAIEFNTKELGTAKYGVTKFSDLSAEEFKTTYLGGLLGFHEYDLPQMVAPNVALKDSVDWVAKGAVTAVKDQGIYFPTIRLC